MSKYIFSMVAMLVCVAGSARANEGISTSTLSDMGLSDMTVMSDSDALAVRGLGWSGGANCKICRAKAPWSAAIGNSFATIGIDGKADGGSHSQNGYFAEGPYAASGANYSEAGVVLTDIEIVDIGGVVKSLTTVWSAKVFAGGSSSSMSF